MKRVVLGALAGAGLVIALSGVLDYHGEVFAQRPSPECRADWGHELIALSGPAGEDGQLVAVIDPRQRVIGVYHVDRATGKIALRSVRNIHWDLQLTEFNSDSPLPREIRGLLQQH